MVKRKGWTFRERRRFRRIAASLRRMDRVYSAMPGPRFYDLAEQSRSDAAYLEAVAEEGTWRCGA